MAWQTDLLTLFHTRKYSTPCNHRPENVAISRAQAYASRVDEPGSANGTLEPHPCQWYSIQGREEDGASCS